MQEDVVKLRETLLKKLFSDTETLESFNEKAVILVSLVKETIGEVKKVATNLKTDVSNTIQSLEVDIKDFENEIKKHLSSEIQKVDKKFDPIDKKYQSIITLYNQILNKLNEFEVKDGKDADEEKIIQEVLKKIPEHKEETGNDLVNKINLLSENDQKIDVFHIKGLEELLKKYKTSTTVGGVSRYLAHLIDVDLTGLSQNAQGQYVLSDGVTDHGALTGLLDDDHPQYLTETRGDARYSLLGHTHNWGTIQGTITDQTDLANFVKGVYRRNQFISETSMSVVLSSLPKFILSVNKNRQMLFNTIDYAVVGATVTFTEALVGDDVEIIYIS